ncbi:MAG TPA: 3-phosphoserine/phosphohydroxythreonine transaminase [Acidobacteriota bacterium]|nr:3-phosphoserine/phosphohydroxythreonine transaminase [Acidobacteriota bacterium]
MAHRIFNFNPGPSTLPLDVLKIVQEELLDYQGTGMSVMEISHRSPQYSEINTDAAALLLEVMGLSSKYKVLFLGGGASTQFAMIPLNFLPAGKTAAYVDTGSWASKAIKEAKIVGNVHLAASSKEQKYTRIPKPSEIDIPSDAAYLHLTSNNTIYGTQYHEWPDLAGVPLMCDMSSDICSRRLDFSKFSLIYAGAQKNLGPAGVTAVIVHESLRERCKDGNLTMLDYRTHWEKDSLFNTPPVFGVYVVKLVLEWIKKQGGLEAVEKVNVAKKSRIYDLLDRYPDYYRGTVEPDSRSWMNLTFRLPSEDLEKKFIAEATAAGMGGLKGHRSVGGVRVSLYNAMPLKGVEKLAEFMEAFKKAN